MYYMQAHCGFASPTQWLMDMMQQSVVTVIHVATYICVCIAIPHNGPADGFSNGGWYCITTSLMRAAYIHVKDLSCSSTSSPKNVCLMSLYKSALCSAASNLQQVHTCPTLLTALISLSHDLAFTAVQCS